MRVPPGRHTYAAVLSAVLLLFPVTTAAQQLDAGTRLRVTTPVGRTVGLLDAPAGDSLVLATSGGRVAFAPAGIELVERSLGRRGHALRGALIGGGVMAVAGVLAIVSDDDEGGEDWGGVVAAAAFPAFVAVGAGTGALVGFAWRTERWAPVQLGVRVSRLRGPE